MPQSFGTKILIKPISEAWKKQINVNRKVQKYYDSIAQKESKLLQLHSAHAFSTHNQLLSEAYSCIYFDYNCLPDPPVSVTGYSCLK